MISAVAGDHAELWLPFLHFDALYVSAAAVAQPWRLTLLRLYLGMEKRNGEVIMDATNKWSNLEYFKLTGLREYAPYMMGGGYVLNTFAQSRH